MSARIALVALFAVSAWAEPEYEENVAVLTPDNFDEFVSARPYSIVEFYAPWCGHCKSLAPEWAAASGKTRKLSPSVPLAKVDADQHRDLAEKYGVSGCVSLSMLHRGMPPPFL